MQANVQFSANLTHNANLAAPIPLYQDSGESGRDPVRHLSAISDSRRAGNERDSHLPSLDRGLR